MSMSIVSANPHRVWMPLAPSEKCYVGALVAMDSSAILEGVETMDVVAGAGNTTNKDIPLGIVTGLNSTAANRVSDSGGEYITQVAAGAVFGSTTEYVGVAGEWARGDRQAMVEVALIDSSTIIKAPIYNAAVGTAPTEVSVTTASSSGIGCHTGAADVATVATYGTIYVRDGANAGIYRTLTTASATVHAWLKAMPAELAVGDKVVVINGLRPYGISRAYIDAAGLYIDCSEALTANYFDIIVVRLDLSTAGNEFVEFKFSGDNFDLKRA